jgi:group I intron endonuclease
MKQSETGVYYILNELNGKCYVGSTADDFITRWNRHKRDLKNDKHDNQHLQNAWNKYGAKNFIFVVLEIVEPLKCLEREQFFIDNIKPEYNIFKIVGPPFGGKFPEMTKLKMSQTHTGMKLSLETRQKIALSHQVSVKQINKETGELIKVWDSMSDAAKFLFPEANEKRIDVIVCGIGTTCSQKQHSSYGFLWQYNNKIYPEFEKHIDGNSKKVRQIDKQTNEIIKTWPSATFAGIAFGKKCPGDITSTCRKEQLTAYGFKWEYVDANKEVPLDSTK